MTSVATDLGLMSQRIARIDKAILDQRAFLHRVPDPDTRQRAENNLMQLVTMSEDARRTQEAMWSPSA